MKNLFYVVSLLVTLQSANAFASAPTDCELLQEMRVEHPFGPKYDLTGAKAEMIARLPAIARKQLILYARSDAGSPPQPITTVTAAVQLLVDGSEGGEVDLENFSLEGRRFTRLLWYPGGNPYGVIFAYGTTRKLATLGDGDFSCVK
ncbi:MAG: hypothetical protein H7222_04325 [Methylotenera sp.]|nr:hypothetical protein [Oligoflexia bacterium]